jgi:hypothetical protein
MTVDAHGTYTTLLKAFSANVGRRCKQTILKLRQKSQEAALRALAVDLVCGISSTTLF